MAIASAIHSSLTSDLARWPNILAVLAALSIALVFYRLIVYRYLIDPLRTLPGPKSRDPIFGYMYETLRRPPSAKFGQWIQEIENDGLLRVPSAFGMDFLLPASSAVLKELLVTQSYDFCKEDRLRDALRPVLGDGLVVSEGEVHRTHRKKLMPLFGHRQIKNLHPLVWIKVVAMVDGIVTATDLKHDGNIKREGVVEVYDWASKATLDIIGRVTLGHDFNTLTNSNDQLASLYEWFFQPDFRMRTFFAASIILPRAVWALVPWPLKWEFTRNSKELHRRCADLVANKKKTSLTIKKESVDMLEHMIDADCFSDKELVDELLTFLAAGHETTSTALAWALYSLAKDRPTRIKCQAEVVKAIDDFKAHQNTTLDSTDFANTLDGLPWLHGTCNESQRLWPSVPGTTRIAVRNTRLGDTAIPRGTRILIPIWSINRLPSLWGADAADFRADRWIDQHTGKPNNHGGCKSSHAFVTYLHGPRSCLGQGLARAELKALLAAWLYCFDFELADPDFEAVAVGNVTVRPEGGLHLRIKQVRSL